MFADLKRMAKLEDSILKLHLISESDKKEIRELTLNLDMVKSEHLHEISKLEQQHEIELDDIKHLVKLKEEKLDIEHEKEKLKLQDEYGKKEMELQKQYHDKTIKNIETGQKDLKDLYSQIMVRLPKVNVGIKESR